MPTQTDWDKVDRSGLRVAATLGRFVLAPLYKRLLRTGQLAIEGRETLFAAIEEGRLIIVINHPTLIDSFFPPMAMYPYWYNSSCFFTWSMPDENFFRQFLKLPFPWIPRVLRCVSVDRSGGRTAAENQLAALDRIVEILQHGHTVVWHIEAGRTSTAKVWEELVWNGQRRRIRKKVTSHVAEVAAHVENCRILTVYLDIPWADGPLGFWTCVWRLISRKHPPMTMYVRNPPFVLDQSLDAAAVQQRLKTGVLTS